MKKTIIAASIAAVVAAPAAFADVTISGQMNYEMIETDNSSAGNTNSDVFLAASDDLGNGLKAGMKIQLVTDDGADTNGGHHAVYLSGGFGTIDAGQMEGYTESKIAALAANDASEEITIEVADGSNAGFSNIVRYTSPSFNGLTVGIEAGETGGTDAVFAKYSNGPLTVQAASEKDGANDIVTISAQYKMGDMDFVVVDQDDDSGSSETFIGASYTMGNNKIAVGVIDGGDTDGDSTISLTHSLSKSTSIYAVVKNDDSASTGDQTGVGMKYSF